MTQWATLVVTAVAAVTLAGCSSSAPEQPVAVSPVYPSPAGAQDVTEVPATPPVDCDREASLRPGPLPAPGAMPPGSSMAAIQERGRLVVGVDQNTFLFGFRNPSTGQLEGFDIDIAHEIARAIFGDPDRVDLRVVDASQREAALQSGQVDLVVRTFSITCARKQNIGFSTVYYNAEQRVLALKGAGIDSAATDLLGKRVCAVNGTTSMATLYNLQKRPELVGVSSWTDCLVMLQQGQVDAISTDDAVLAGLARQDPTVEMMGDSLGVEPYGVGVRLENVDLVRFVNAVLERMRDDGTWERLYARHLQSFGPSPGPPAPRYQD
ncbi:ABC transporter substrate-binding protein [Mycobacterium sp. MS1601]|uniref:glutamate ABC transporter substrate-binding protein n=1 Tax=Mycobacterium sp. MS1601 TaxID=1936029 RepID=UPI0009790709|nr:glutamate ABC transporter substrate-binding protein [Mycobacterium sp. MS1601]AQA01239.1 ABC transporter substrate-binding protein [Mycobacterium sp. MS1601]